MVKHISLINRHAGQTFEEFRDYWMNVHSQLVKGILPGLRKYVANFPAELGGTTPPGSGTYLTCDAIVELHFDSYEALLAGMASAGWLSKERRESSARLMDQPRNLFLIGEEVVVDLGS